MKLNNIQLTLNGQERHPGLDKGIDTDYLMNRLLPQLHSNSNNGERFMFAMDADRATDYRLKGSKPIFVYPFSLNPEGSNPSGAVNFSKVSHAKLTLHLAAATESGLARTSGLDADTSSAKSGLRVDVYGLYYNWLQIKDGRALLSFA